MPLGPDLVSLVDFWHAAEYLGAAAKVFEIKRKAKPGQFRRWRHALKHDEGAAAQIVEQLEQSGLDKVMLDGARPVEAAIRYFRARLERMNYAAARRQGLPIGSAPEWSPLARVESWCLSLDIVRPLLAVTNLVRQRSRRVMDPERQCAGKVIVVDRERFG